MRSICFLLTRATTVLLFKWATRDHRHSEDFTAEIYKTNFKIIKYGIIFFCLFSFVTVNEPIYLSKVFPSCFFMIKKEWPNSNLPLVIWKESFCIKFLIKKYTSSLMLSMNVSVPKKLGYRLWPMLFALTYFFLYIHSPVLLQNKKLWSLFYSAN